MYSKRKTRHLKIHAIVTSSTKPKSSHKLEKSNNHDSLNHQIPFAPSPVVSNSNKLTTTLTKNHQSIKKPSPKVSQVLLGFSDGNIGLEEDIDPYLSKIGGVPNWLIKSFPPPYDFIICKNCEKEMFLLFQGFIPLEESPYERIIYVWVCNQQKCMKCPGSFRAIRAHRLDENTIFNLGDTLFSTQDMPSAMGGLDGMLFDNDNGADKLSANITSKSMLPKAQVVYDFDVNHSSNTPTWSQIVAGPAAVNNVDSKLHDDITTKLVISDVSEIFSNSPWPEKIPFFPAQYLYITEEILEEKPDPNLKKYERYLNASLDNNEDDSFDWMGEKYEKSCLPRGVDKAFRKFSDRVSEWPDQCIRYEFDGQPLLYNQSDPTASLLLSSPHGSVKQLKTSTQRLPKCPKCGSKRVFEFQLMPNMLCILPTGEYATNSSEKKNGIKDSKCGIAQFDVGMEWGTIMIFTCQKDCETYNVSKDEVSYYEELVLVQYEL
ncbi:24968_t:CDS:2 [Gigaspora margarita]|uniref:24968_t:CDS:1 n=1 Tax=Gigaspora margarita TaxID=4874 RepID=A0ABN7W9S9_GIGMA|nr:24968_t:CDS:2 [Gigaspora margarita]